MAPTSIRTTAGVLFTLAFAILLGAGCETQRFQRTPEGDLIPLDEDPPVPEPEDVEFFAVAEVPSGDSIVLEDGRRIHYLGLTAPSQGERFFQESLRANESLVGDRRVTLKYGEPRVVDGVHQAMVIVEYPPEELFRLTGQRVDEGKNHIRVDRALLGTGSVRVDRRVVRGRLLEYYLALESGAMERRIGIWQP